MIYNFAVFIITHKRPHSQWTYETLRKSGYTGKIYLVLDDMDLTRKEYETLYSDILVFNKKSYVSMTDTGLSDPFINYAVFARNAVEDFAKQLNLDCFLVLDDDITKFRLRYIHDNSVKSKIITHGLDTIFNYICTFIQSSNISCLSFGNISTYIGGITNFNSSLPRNRILFMSFFRNTNYLVRWKLNMLEDTITSIECAIQGQVWLKLLCVQIDVMPVGGIIDGGNSETYSKVNKFKSTFFPIMVRPSCYAYTTRWLKTFITGSTPEIKHNMTIPRLLSSRYKKGEL